MSRRRRRRSYRLKKSKAPRPDRLAIVVLGELNAWYGRQLVANDRSVPHYAERCQMLDAMGDVLATASREVLAGKLTASELLDRLEREARDRLKPLAEVLAHEIDAIRV